MSSGENPGAFRSEGRSPSSPAAPRTRALITAAGSSIARIRGAALALTA
eukprot:CAMPEP_0119520780 /NCGR_PEP_ID=MMETSP1344-20130328/36701_1 /TAXON_ID=236787 /ORGANISM="Florenciella parvula, Strain CCMP2471" /LENGTH=48 /DNA_ID= /DNA_START= /DNA_END= /DNA_ORIENTATION=